MGTTNVKIEKEVVKTEQERLNFFYEELCELNEEYSVDITSILSLDRVNWFEVSHYLKLSEDFIREFQDRVNWCSISSCQELSEDFIREFKDRVDWEEISHYQRLSEDFIREFKDRVDWYYISGGCQELSDDFKKEFAEYING